MPKALFWHWSFSKAWQVLIEITIFVFLYRIIFSFYHHLFISLSGWNRRTETSEETKTCDRNWCWSSKIESEASSFIVEGFWCFPRRGVLFKILCLENKNRTVIVTLVSSTHQVFFTAWLRPVPQIFNHVFTALFQRPSVIHLS